MLKVKTSDELDVLAGRARTRPATPPPAPTAPAPNFERLEQALFAVAAEQRTSAQAVLELARPKQMEAQIVRDSDGRMSKVVITVKHEK